VADVAVGCSGEVEGEGVVALRYSSSVVACVKDPPL